MAIETSNSINVTPRSRSCILVTSSDVSNSRYAVRRKPDNSPHGRGKGWGAAVERFPAQTTHPLPEGELAVIHLKSAA